LWISQIHVVGEIPATMKTSTAHLFVAALVLCSVAAASAQKVEDLLEPFPNFSSFRQLLISTGIINEVDMRSSLTFLMPDNAVLSNFVASHQSLSPQEVTDVLSYHVLLQYLDVGNLQTLAYTPGSQVTTLYQTSGRANGQDGFVNITGMANNVISVSAAAPGSPSQAVIITNVTAAPYNYSFFQINNVLVPLNLRPTAPTPAPSAGPVGAPMMGPSTGPSMAPATTTPSGAPTKAPVKAPVMAPMRSPAKSPVKAPALSPASVGPGSMAPGPSEAMSGGSIVQSSGGLLMVALVAMATLL
jgi:hypothetical protein